MNSLPAGTSVTVKVKAAAILIGSTNAAVTAVATDTIKGGAGGGSIPLHYADKSRTLGTHGTSNWVAAAGAPPGPKPSTSAHGRR